MDDPKDSPGQDRPTLLDRISALLMREPENREDLVAIMRSAFERKLVDGDALSMIEGVLSVSETTVRDIMIPRAQMDCVSVDDEPAEFMPLVVETRHSRFPVIGESKDDIVGILLAKELLNYYANPEAFNLHDTLRPAVFIPEGKRLNVLLREFRANRNHIAIVVDEYGGVSGLVTIEDVLEQIVGDIEDEYDFDESEDNMIPEAGGRWRVKAQTEIADFNAHFATRFDDDEFDTVGGLVLRAFGRLAARRRRYSCVSLSGETGRALRLLLAFAAGAATVFGYAPFNLALLPLATLSALFWLWHSADRPRTAAAEGFAFGIGLFGVGISWISVALETFGGVPPTVALLGMLGLVAYLALFPALAGWVAARITLPAGAGRLVAAVAAWTLAEWLRGWLFTGFGWLSIGYTQLLPSTALPLAGFAPVGGVYLVSLAVAACAAESSGCAAVRIAGPGQCRAEPEIRSRVPHAELRDVLAARASCQGAAGCPSGERLHRLSGRSAGRSSAGTGGYWTRARGRGAPWPFHDRAAGK